MHPSSFYDLQARYIYTPLYGPYSLSEALEGLVFYSLKESRDSVSIGSKRALQHELISELSNVIDDLQDYLVYFSSTFLISPLNSPDFIQELRASHVEFKHLIVCWGAIVACLAIARKIVERNFWPHLFQLAINNLAALRRLGRPPSLVLPNVPSKKSFAPTSGFISSSPVDSAACSANPPSQVQRQLHTVQGKRPQTMPSNINPTGSKEDRTSSLTLDTTPTSSESHHPRILSSHRSPNVVFDSHFPRIYEDRLDKVLAPPKLAFAAQHLCSSTPSYKGNTREFVDLKNEVEVVEIDKKVSRETEGEDNTEVPGPCLCPIPLTPLQAEAASEHIAAVPARTSTSATASRPSTMAPCISSPTPSFYWGSTTPSTCSFGRAIPQAWTCSSLSTAVQSTSTTPDVFNSLHNPPRGPIISLPRSILLPQLFANTIPRPSTRPFSNGPHTRLSVLPAPPLSLSTTETRPSKAQPLRFTSSPVSPITPPFQRHSFDFPSVCPPLDTSQPCPDDQGSPKELPSPVTVDNAGDMASSTHHVHSTSSPTSPFSPSLNLNTTPTHSGSHTTRIPSNGQPSVIPPKSCFSQKCKNRSDEVFTLPNRTTAARHFCSSTSAHPSNTREPGNSKDKAEVVWANGLVTGEIEVEVEGEEVTKVPCAYSPPVQLTPVQGKATRGWIMASTGTSSLLTTSRPSSTSSQPSSMTLRLMSITRVPARTSPPLTASWPTSTT